MPFDPEDILGEDPGKGKKPSSGFDPLDIKAAAQGAGQGQTNQNLISGTIDPNTNFNDFRFQPKTNADNLKLRAQDQGFWESMGKTLGNVVANIPLDIIQGVGYLGTMIETGDTRDYSNNLTRELEKLKSPFGEVYQESPEKEIDLTDSAWWMNNLGGLVESAASFAVEGAGIAKIFGTIAKGAAWSAKSAKVGAKIAQGLSAGTLSYMEGAMSGARVFETAYNNNYMKLYEQGLDPSEADEQAKHIASQAAAATVQIHTAMNVALNLTGLNPMFRDPDQAIVSWWRKNGAALPGETTEQWTKRIANAVPDSMPLKKLLGMGATGPARLGLEAIQEGLEEVNTQYAEHVGAAIGEGKEEKDVFGRLADVDRYFKEVLNEEGALNMALGALGGIAQTAIMDNIPVHKVIKYGSDGQPLLTEQGATQTERVSAHTMNDRMNRQYFDNIKDALSKDMQWFGEKNKEMETALKNKDLATLARARADLLSVHNLRAISMGMGDMWKQQYQDIMSLDNTKPAIDLMPQIEEITTAMQEAFNSGDVDTANQLNAERMKLMDQQNAMQDTTEAMQKGYAQNKSDNSYKERAQQAIQNLDYLTKLYHEMDDKYTGTPELDQSGLGEHMFYRQANLYLHKQQLDIMNQDILKLRARIEEMTLTEQDDMLIKQAQEFNSDREVWDNTVKKLNQDITRFNEAMKANNVAVVKQLLGKYKIPASPRAAKELVDALERRKKALQDKAGFTNKELNDTIAVWKEMNPGKEIKDVLQKSTERTALQDILQQNKAYYQEALTEYETAKEQLASDTTNESIRRFLKENKPADTKAQNKKDHIEAYGQQMDREIAATLDAKQKLSEVEKIDARIKEIDGLITERKDRIDTNKRENSQRRGFKHFIARKLADVQIEADEADIQKFLFEKQHLLDRRNAMAEKAQQAAQQAQNVSRTPPPVAPVTTPSPGATPAENTTEQAEFNETLPDFDFSSEIIPAFTTLEAGEVVFDQLVGGQEAGSTLRKFIEIKKLYDVPYLINGVKTMIDRTNLPMPTDQEFEQFITPYVTALKDQYLAQKLNPEQEYENMKAFLVQDVLTVLDIVEEEFRQHGFSYDRLVQVLNQQVKDGKMAKNLIGQVATTMKAYLDYTQQPVSKEPEHVAPVDAATSKDTYLKSKQNSDGTITLYRGIQASGEQGTGQFWTTNQDIARWYADRFGQTGEVATINVPYDVAFQGFMGFEGKPGRAEGSDIFSLEPSRYNPLMNTSGYFDDIIASKQFNEEPTTYIPPTPDSEATIFSNAALDLDVVQQENKRFVGASNIEGVKANFNTHPYKEFDNGTEIRRVSDYTEIDPGLNLDVLIPGMVNPGDDVIFEVDENWAGEINIDNELVQDDYGDNLRKADTFQNYLELPNKVGMTSTAQHPRGAHANVPIKIIQKSTGKTLGYLPRADWITKKYADTQNYANIVDEYQDEDVTVTDNVARQYGRIMKLRENIVRSWNTNPDLKMESKVSKRGTGHVMLNREVNPNTGRTKLVNRSAKNMLPDTSLEIAIVKQGTAYVGSGIASQKQVSSKLPNYMKNATSLPVVMLPSPDGTHVPVPLYTHRLGDNPGTINTIELAIELYLSYATSAGEVMVKPKEGALKKILEETGFDLRTHEGLRDFIQQYFTYTQKFSEKDTVITPSEVTSAVPEFMLDIPNITPGEAVSFIKIGTSFSGERPLYARLVNGALDPEFADALRNGLKNRFKSVIFAGKSLRGINSSGEFKSVTIRRDLVVATHRHASYNEYVKASSTTFVYGLNQAFNPQTGKTQYVYMANPVVQVDYEQALRSAPPVVSTSITERPPESTTSEDEIFEEPDELADLFGNGILSPSPGSVQPLLIPQEGEQVSLELLQNLRNLTPEAHRNTLSPEQVLRELLERGVTVLAEGHNPFYIC